MRYRNDNMLLRIAQGDAYAAAIEYVKPKEHPQLYEDVLKFERYLQHPTHTKLRPGMYTDDGQMSIAISEYLIDVRTRADYVADREQGIFGFGEEFNHDDFASYFFNTFKRDQRDGYSRKFQAILEEATDATHLRQLLVPDSNKNGAAMRSVPLGVLPNPDLVVKVAGIQASVTHNTWGGINSSIAVALMSHYALYDRRDFSSMYQWCVRQLPAFELFREPWVGGVGLKGTDTRDLGIGMCTAHAVHTLLTQEKSLMDIMKRVIEWRGDTDSVAAVAWGIASARYQDEVLPEFLEYGLEAQGNLKYGPQFLKDLGRKLMDSYDSKCAPS